MIDSYLKTMTHLVQLGRRIHPEPSKSPDIVPSIFENDATEHRDSALAALDGALARLEGEGASHVFADGQAVLDALVETLPPGSRILVSQDLEPGLRRNLESLHKRNGLDLRKIDASRHDAVRRALRDKVALLLVESPSDPLLNVRDLRALSHMAHDQQVLFAVDNTFLGGALQHPLELGADFVVYSNVRWIGGEAEGSAAVLSSRRPEHSGPIESFRTRQGSQPDAAETHALLRGLRTLHLRTERAQSNAQRVALWLSRNSTVQQVNYPATDFERFRQSEGPGWIVSFELEDPWRVRAFLRALRVWRISEYASGFDSTASHPWSRSHLDLSEEERHRAGISENLIRLAVGLEDVDDLIDDLDQALSNPNFSFTDVWDWVI
jgi:cystathionine beta-lyase/cystathionine gamma-synthase